jgi:hypothetical protein
MLKSIIFRDLTPEFLGLVEESVSPSSQWEERGKRTISKKQTVPIVNGWHPNGEN